MLNAFAHADETHVTSGENLTHLLEVWYTAVPTYLIATALLVVLTYRLTKKSFNKTFVVGAGWLLISGVLLYDLSPVISTIGIVFGLLSSAIISLLSLTKTK